MIKLARLVITSVIIFAIASTVFAGPVTTNGNLQVAFSTTFNSMTLCNQSGAPVQLKGMSSMGLQWFPWGQSPWGAAYPDTKAVPHLVTWGSNVVRAAMYVGEGGYLGNETAMMNKVKSIVEAAIAADIYVIVDWHVLSGGTENPKNNQAEAETFFAQMSALYGNKPNVIWEICNEPNGATTWANIKEYATGWGSYAGVIPTIRANDPDSNKNIIIVGTPNWSQWVWHADANPIAEPNVMYAFHFYASSRYHVFEDSPEWAGIPALSLAEGHDGIGRAADTTLNRGNIAIFVTEWGVCEETGNGVFDVAKTDYYVDWMASRNISWTNWSLCNKAETASALTGGSGETGWDDATNLSASGAYVKNRIGGGGTPGPTDPPSTPAPTLDPGTAAPTAENTPEPPTPAPTAEVTNPPSGLYPCDQNCASKTTLIPPFVFNGAGEFCFEADSLGENINSWNIDGSLELNGVNIKNIWVGSGSYPAPIGGKYYLYYKCTGGAGHVEINGAASSPAPTDPPTPDPTAGPTADPTAVPPTPDPTAVPTPDPTPIPGTPDPTAVPTPDPTTPPSTGCDLVITGTNSGAFNTTGAFCFKTQSAIGGWGVSNFDGRTISVTVNGTGTAVTTPGAALPSKGASDYYVFQCSAGGLSWAAVYWW